MTDRFFCEWAISRRLWDVMRPMLSAGMVTLETGSGLSTLLVEAAGCRHTALEHDEEHAAPSDCVVVAPLVGKPPWYDWEPAHPFDLILIDGPPGHVGRSGILRVFDRLIARSTIVVVDDTHRCEEKRLADTLCQKYGFEQQFYGEPQKSFSVLTRAG